MDGYEMTLTVAKTSTIWIKLSTITRPVAAIKSLRFAFFSSFSQTALWTVFFHSCLSVVCHTFYNVPVVVSSWKSNHHGQKWCPWKVKVRSQSLQSQKSKQFCPNLGIFGPWLQFQFTDVYKTMHKPWSGIEQVRYIFSRSSIKFQGHMGWKITNFDLWVSRL